jgi:hypothetical protein
MTPISNVRRLFLVVTVLAVLATVGAGAHFAHARSAEAAWDRSDARALATAATAEGVHKGSAGTVVVDADTQAVSLIVDGRVVQHAGPVRREWLQQQHEHQQPPAATPEGPSTH